MERIGDLILEKPLDQGNYGTVYLSRKGNSDTLYATKKINKPKTEEDKKFFETETKIMRELNHPNVIKLIDLKMDSNYYYIVMELANGGNLSLCLQNYIKKYNNPFPEEIVQHLMKQIVSAIAYIHSMNVIHRDLKLKNIMVNFDSDIDKQNLNMMKAKIKIIDFGISKINEEAFSLRGTPNYMDPMLLEEYTREIKDKLRPYRQEVDIWSLGCLCYELYMGELLFKSPEKVNSKKYIEVLFEQIKNGKYYLFKYVSPELKDFLSQMIQYDGNSRLTAKELLDHPFLTRKAKDFNKFPINSPKPTIYTQKQYTSQFYSNTNTNTNGNTDNNKPISYYGDLMTKNLESKIQTTNSQLGQYPFLQQYNFLSHIPPSPYQEENNI
jgi:serine/threonine protein kinase